MVLLVFYVACIVVPCGNRSTNLTEVGWLLAIADHRHPVPRGQTYRCELARLQQTRWGGNEPGRSHGLQGLSWLNPLHNDYDCHDLGANKIGEARVVS